MTAKPPCAICNHVSEDPRDFRTNYAGRTVCTDRMSCEFDRRELAAAAHAEGRA